MKIRIINRSENPMPEYQTPGSAGMDLRAANTAPITLKPMERTLVPTGIFLELPQGIEGQVRARSGLSIKHGITMINAIGTIDSDYRGELRIPVVNLSQEEYTIRYGDRIAQLVLARYERVELEPVDRLDDTARGSGGFGSTGV